MNNAGSSETSSDGLATPWARPAAEVLRSLRTTVDGLDRVEAGRRKRQFGANELRRTAQRSSWRILLDQFTNLIVALLAVAAVVAFAFDETVEATAVVAVILLNAAIGFFTERRALRSMEALRELGRTEATVRRDGAVTRVTAAELVPGDIVILDAGDVLSADCRVLQVSRLQADESALTGESMPVEKSSSGVSSEAPLGERNSMLYKGTSVIRASGEAVVVTTGMRTELARHPGWSSKSSLCRHRWRQVVIRCSYRH